MTIQNLYTLVLGLMGEETNTVYGALLPPMTLMTLQKMHPSVAAFYELHGEEAPAYPETLPALTDTFPYDVAFFTSAVYGVASALVACEDQNLSEQFDAKFEALLALAVRKGKSNVQ